MPQSSHFLTVIVAMGFFSALFGCFKGNGPAQQDSRYVTDDSFRRNLGKQTTMSPQTVAQLRQYGVTDDTKLKLEFFFYTDTEAKAVALASPLKTHDYEVHAGLSAGDSGLFLVTGWSKPIKMDEISVVKWTKQMCRLGYDHDCEFDGWGTNPEQ